MATTKINLILNLNQKFYERIKESFTWRKASNMNFFRFQISDFRFQISDFRFQISLKPATKLNQKKSVSGFTMIELLCVIIIVGSLTASAIPQLLDFRNGIEHLSTTVVSRRNHGGTNYDIPVIKGGLWTVEPRSGGSYTLIFTFLRTITNAGTATLIEGSPAIIGALSIGPNPNQITVPISGVSSRQRLHIKLDGPINTAGVTINNIEARLKVLVGDLNGNGIVDAGDVQTVQQNTRSAITQLNFLSDINSSGVIDGNDVSAAQTNVGTVLIN
jgi:prepilin-type N-terminal cleavage/methylation domain-containing protein